ncbi:hypothetical protein X942_5413 [Burkholderia pseudomallei MSHR5596]|nr:hypothetical protein X942_5413 [Burkholderia pseudomallei MSHR5596]
MNIAPFLRDIFDALATALPPTLCLPEVRLLGNLNVFKADILLTSVTYLTGLKRF